MTFNTCLRSIEAQVDFPWTRRVARAGAVCAMAALGACQSVSTNHGVEASFQRVGVVSVTAMALSSHTVGGKESNEGKSVRDISQWGVDRAYEEQLASAVQFTFGAVAVRGASPPAELLRMNDPSTPFVQPGFWDYRADPIAESVRAFCASNQIDALVVASASVDDDVLGGTYHPISGAGVYVREGNHLLFLSTALTLIDCATGRPMERHRVASGRSFAASHGYPVRDLTMRPAAAAAPGDGAPNEQIIKEALIALPAEAWADTLRGMLRSDGPPAFGRTLLPGT